MGRGAENGLPDGFKGRFIESVPAAFFYGRTHQKPHRVKHQFHEHLSLDTFALRQTWVTRCWRLEEFRPVHGVE